MGEEKKKKDRGGGGVLVRNFSPPIYKTKLI